MSEEQEQARLFERLWTDFLEGELDEDGAKQLRDLLAGQQPFVKTAVEQYQIHRLLGVLLNHRDSSAEWFVRETLERVSREREEFSARTMRRIMGSQPGHSSQQVPVHPVTKRRVWSSLAMAGGWITAGIVMVAFFSIWHPAERVPPQAERAGAETTVPAEEPVRFSRLARAQFFGELSPGMNTPVPLQKTYVLTGGMVELAFPRGALAIIEGPAVFRARDGDCLELDSGHCSVYAPDGAEGFRVDTPDANVIDRGTRFTVDVTEFNETEVQVIEGMADLYQKPVASARDASETAMPAGPQELRLTERQAVRVQASSSFQTEPADFRPDQYRRQLPDRVISYTATTAEDGRAEHLLSVTVQRNGEENTYPVEQLIPVELIWFRSTEVSRDGHFLGREALPEQRTQLCSDTSLATGVINPGGSRKPLTSNPVMEHDPLRGVSGTPGIAYRFRTPVINRPGPDIVFFETHPISSPTDGDAFHISPLNMQNGRRAYTVTSYDLSLLSPEALPVTQMFAHILPNRKINSLDELLTYETQGRPVRYDYRVLAVGIDLSELGYQPGEEADGIFIQDAEDGHGRVDPVFIGGLP